MEGKRFVMSSITLDISYNLSLWVPLLVTSNYKYKIELRKNKADRWLIARSCERRIHETCFKL